MPEPPDVFSRTGLPAPVVGVRWIESTGPGGGTREYYENALESRGEKFEIGVRLHLVVSDGTAGQQKTYDWTEYLFPYEPVGAPLINSIKLTGTVAVDTAAGAIGPLTVYHFDNAAISEQFRTLVRFQEALVLPGLAGIAAASPDTGANIPLHATATAQRVVVTDKVADVLGFKIRLRVGDELVTRLRRPASLRPYELSPASVGMSLVFQSSRDEPNDGTRSFHHRAAPARAERARWQGERGRNRKPAGSRASACDSGRAHPGGRLRRPGAAAADSGVFVLFVFFVLEP